MKNLPSSVKWVHLQAAASAANSVLIEDIDSAVTCAAEQPVTICEKMLRSVKGVIFDFDGTLFDNSSIAFRLISANPIATLRVWKERLIRSSFAGRDFLTSERYYRAFFTELGRACYRPPERLRNWYFNHYMPRMIRVLKKHYKARPKVKELLQKIDSPESAIKAAVYSDYPILKERMKAIGLPTTDRIPLYGPESFGAQKPAVRPFLQIAKNMNLQPEEILVIGDREETDGIGAFNAGMHFFCLETGRKRYYRLDPNRHRIEEEPHGPKLLMYAGRWEEIVNLLMQR